MSSAQQATDATFDELVLKNDKARYRGLLGLDGAAPAAMVGPVIDEIRWRVRPGQVDVVKVGC